MNKKTIIALFAVTVLAAVVIIFWTKSDDKRVDRAYGHIDIRQSYLSFERSGRIEELLVDEGDMVKKGDMLARLDTKSLDHQISIQEAQCRQAKASLDEAHNGSRSEEIEQAKAAVDRLTQSYKLAKLSNDRYQKLYKSKNASEQDKDNAYYNMTQILGQLNEARAKYDLVKAGARSEIVDKAQATFDTCQSNLEYLQYQKDEQSIIKAPFDGVIRVRKAEPGDMASPQSSVFELSMLNVKRARIYVNELQLHSVRVGAKATVETAFGDEVPGTIAYISSTAMFTPKTVQSEDLRAELVYEVRVDVDDKSNVLRLGQPVTVYFFKNE